jgi:hypothetical protein
MLSARHSGSGQLFQFRKDVVVDGEADADGNGALDPVHAEAFIETTDDAFVSSNIAQSPPNALAFGDPSRLHSSSDNVQWIGRGLTDETGECAKSKP